MKSLGWQYFRLHSEYTGSHGENGERAILIDFLFSPNVVTGHLPTSEDLHSFDHGRCAGSRMIEFFEWINTVDDDDFVTFEYVESDLDGVCTSFEQQMPLLKPTTEFLETAFHSPDVESDDFEEDEHYIRMSAYLEEDGII